MLKEAINLNQSIKYDSQVYWCAELESGVRIFHQNRNDGQSEWLLLKDYIHNTDDRICRVHLFSASNIIDEHSFNGMLTPENKEGYFFAQKLFSGLGNQTIQMWGIGHLQDNEITIRWFDKDMSLVDNEKRDPSRASVTLIRN